MRFQHHPALRCPHDRQPLDVVGGCLRCAAGHSFDIAARGYVNLLRAGDRRSRDPGDSRAMVAARHRFLERGHYAPVADAIHDLLSRRLPSGAVVVDAGCGEGYYLQRLREQSLQGGQPEPVCIGFDISRWAVQAAAKRFPASWLVASNRNIPLADGSVDGVLDLFGFPRFDEFRRILAPTGHVVCANAGPRHLLELRELLYDDVTVRDRSGGLPEGFTCEARQQLSYRIETLERDAIADLLLMTPHMFRAPREGRDRVAACRRLDVTVDVTLTVLTHSVRG
jgi:23S rRNA (guanine745-N1)-methyltransferase